MGSLTIDGYRQRIVDETIERYLNAFGAVVIEGPKWCGKTTTAKNHAASETSMANPEGNFRERTIARLEPELAIKGARPRLIDEWQDVPKLWDAVRYECDKSREKGLFLLTGSTVPKRKKDKDTDEDNARPKHSGAGRMIRIKMNTMTLFELGISSGEIPLSGLFEENAYSALSNLDLSKITELVTCGGWPAAMGMNTEDATLISRGYLDAVVDEDIHEVDGISRDTSKVRKLIQSLARNESSLASGTTIMKDVVGAEKGDITRPTYNEYLDALRRIFFVDDIPAWSPNLRSPLRVRATQKRHLADPSLSAAALGASPTALMQDPKTLGLLFESLAIHDLKVYAEAIGAEVMHYRDESGLEVDAIVERANGDWAAFEIKLGFEGVDKGAATLISLKNKMLEHGQKAPQALGVIVGVGGVGHMRSDEVQVIPLDTLC